MNLRVWACYCSWKVTLLLFLEFLEKLLIMGSGGTMQLRNLELHSLMQIVPTFSKHTVHNSPKCHFKRKFHFLGEGLSVCPAFQPDLVYALNMFTLCLCLWALFLQRLQQGMYHTSSRCCPLVSQFKYTPYWRGGATSKAFGLAISRSRVQILLKAVLRNNLRQVVYTYVPLSPSSITWYRPKGGDALRLGR